jgi:hypothetical protein
MDPALRRQARHSPVQEATLGVTSVIPDLLSVLNAVKRDTGHAPRKGYLDQSAVYPLVYGAAV